MRLQRSLAGQWQFQLDPAGALTVATLSPDRDIPVPMPWQAAFPDLQRYNGYAWYRREVDVDEAWLTGELLLRFGAVDYWCQVFVNGQLVGEHEGGYTPFTIPIARSVQPGRNEIAVRVYDAAQTGMTIERWPTFDPRVGADGPPFDPAHVPHGKQEWYINVGGIWQDVTLTAVPLPYIDSVQITPDMRGHAHIAVQVAGGGAADGALRARVEDGAGGVWEAAEARAILPTLHELSVTVENVRLWEMATPNLYTARVSLGDDEVSVRFGFREIATANGQILLNGKPIFLLAVLDQALYPDTIYTVPSEAFLRDEFSKAKALGLNCLRCHIKPPEPLYLDLADEMGLLVWAEIPSWRTFYRKGTLDPNEVALDDAIKRRAERLLEEMVRRDFNHPSIVIWTIINEDWGTALPLSASDRAWVAQMYDRCKGLDPTRLVVDNSACPHPWGPNVHVKSDLDDFHIYASIPDHAPGFNQTLEQFDLRPLWTYSTHGDTTRSGQEPLLLSEFGNWGLPSVEKLRLPTGSDPAWFNLGAWWSPWDGEAGWPRGVEERFHRFGLDQIWPTYESFAEASQWHQYESLKFEIETMRRLAHLRGYVITELTDAYWESNGLLDFHRNPKTYFDVFHTINAPDVIVPQVNRYAYWDDEDVVSCVHVARYGGADWAGAKLRWRPDGAEWGQYDVGPVERGTVRALGLLRQPVAAVGRATMQRTTLTLEANGPELARNTLDVLALPASARQATYREPVVVATQSGAAPLDLPLPALTQMPGETTGTPDDAPELPRGRRQHMPRNLGVLLQEIGYTTVDKPSGDTRLAIADSVDAELLTWVRNGGALLYIGYGPSPFFWIGGRGGPYSGNWITCFNWLRLPVYRRLGGVTNPLGLPFMRVMPQRVILGLPLDDAAVQGDILAGMVSGWVAQPAAHTVQFRYGRGRVIMSTFAFREALPAEPTAVALLHDLVDHLMSDACQPTLAASY
ncbi:MAG: glycoside hydrolase family 2 TIM barrel-domain containing protein [Anaerolineae bacterium]